MDVVPLTAESPEDLLDEWARLYRDLVEEEIPELEPPDRDEARAELVSNEEHEAIGFLAIDGTTGIGALLLHLPQREDLDRANSMLYVAPEARRQGVARQLLATAAEPMRRSGRVVLRGELTVGSGAEHFAAAVGARETQRVVRSRLDLSAVDRDDLIELAARQPAGYNVVSWSDRCPDDLVDAFAQARAAMNDAPHGDAERDPLSWDAPRVRCYEERQLLRGYRGLTAVAVHGGSGEVAGFTEIYAGGVSPRGVEQEDTAVVAAHRGHGLGLLIKAVNLLRLLEAEPTSRWIVTWNAADNRHMRAVNEQLGFAPYAEEQEIELAIG